MSTYGRCMGCAVCRGATPCPVNTVEPDGIFDDAAVRLSITCWGCGQPYETDEHNAARDIRNHAECCRRDLLDEVTR